MSISISKMMNDEYGYEYDDDEYELYEYDDDDDDVYEYDSDDEYELYEYVYEY